MSKRNSIYFQLLRQLILSAVISAVVFAGLDFAVSYLIGRYLKIPFMWNVRMKSMRENCRSM